MILREITDTLIRAINGGVDTIDSKYDPLYIEKLIPQIREQAIVIDYFGDRYRGASRRIDFSLIQPTTVSVDTGIDPDVDYVTFTIPKPVKIGGRVDGLVYVGQKDNSISFAKAYNREDIANMRMRNMFNGTVIAYLWEGDKLEVYGNKMLTEVNVRGVFADPTSVSGFGIETDQYPVNESLLLIMTDLFKAQMNIAIAMPADKGLDGKEQNGAK
jgi:hypothetical protein